MRQLLLLLSSVLLSVNLFATRVEFFKGNLASVEKKAAVENKLYFIDFVANYCYLCKLMDETTFVDDELARYIENSYIPYKVNVDDFDGYNLKIKYKIKLLPTILVFDSKGNLLARYEESMSAGKMMKELQRYDTKENRGGRGSGSFAEDYKPPTPKIIEKPIVKPTIEPTDDYELIAGIGRQVKKSNTEYTPPKPKSITVVEEEANEKESEEVTGQGLFEFQVKRHPSSGYGIQIGAFSDYSNVLTEVERLEALFNRPILVNINALNDKVVYKIILGTFKTSREAVAYRNVMRSKGVDGVISDLSKLK